MANTGFIEMHLDPSEDAITLGLSRFANEIENFKEFFEEHLQPVLADIFGDQFQTEGSRGPAGKWAPLSPDYARRKPPGLPILVRSGELKNMLTDERAMIAQAFKDTFTLWVNKYGVFHQAGSRDGTLPQRKVVDLSDSDKIRIGQAFHHWAHKKWAEISKENFRQAIIGESELRSGLERAVSS